MTLPYLGQMLDYLTAGGAVLGVLWAVLAILTVVLLILTRTRWGQSRTLRKCVFLSLAIHTWLACLSTTVQPIPTVTTRSETSDMVVHIAPADEPDLPPEDARPQTSAETKPWERLAEKAPAGPQLPEPPRLTTTAAPPSQRKSEPKEPRLPGDLSLADVPLAEAARPNPKPSVPTPEPRTAPDKKAEAIESPVAQRREAQRPLSPVPAEPKRAEVDPAPTAHDRKNGGGEGLPSALLAQPGPLPKVNLTPVTNEPSKMLASPSDHGPSRPTKPAETLGPAGGSPAEPDRAYEASSAAGRLWTASAIPGSGTASRQSPAGEGPSAVLTGLPMVSLKRHTDQPQTHQVPAAYKLRMAPDRAAIAQRHGASTDSERAVRSALDWLAQAQVSGGYWDPAAHDGGRETRVAGRDRNGAGRDSQSGVTGLALLAFLAAGHTHQEGEYRPTVRRGLEYLLRIQGHDGNLGGSAKVYERMYCHAMASFALSEALGMSGDEQLLAPVRRAVGYTLKAQNPTTGGWRYLPGDPGDTSQLGWQYMALKSADLAGIQIPEVARRGAAQFLQDVSSGRQGGTASYRRGESPSRAMTAEAIVCWQLLGMRRDHPAAAEATEYLLGELPGQGDDNLYYWYYATLALYQLQGDAWTRWNKALQTRLIATQRRDGTLAGSWDPDRLWGSYGGRVYGTALSALCLEVYYRFLPLYREIQE